MVKNESTAECRIQLGFWRLWKSWDDRIRRCNSIKFRHLFPLTRLPFPLAPLNKQVFDSPSNSPLTRRHRCLFPPDQPDNSRLIPLPLNPLLLPKMRVVVGDTSRSSCPGFSPGILHLVFMISTSNCAPETWSKHAHPVCFFHYLLWSWVSSFGLLDLKEVVSIWIFAMSSHAFCFYYI